MPLDRAAILRNAEKLLRQGKLEQAIAEYLRIVEDQPRDWNTANVLGDLYVRGGKIEKAVEQYARIADHLNAEGFYQKAAALYKKVLKLRPDHEHALLQAAEIAAGQGHSADARTYFNAVAERRRANGDDRGAAQIVLRLGSIDPNDYDARLAAARVRVRLGDAAGAVGDFKAIAAELVDKGRAEAAFQALREASAIQPDDDGLRAQLFDMYLAAGDFVRARECASTAAQFKALAARLEESGQAAESLAALREAARRAPEDLELRTRLARSFAARGDMAAAAEFLTAETAGDDPRLLLAAAEIQLNSGRTADGLEIVRRLLERDPNRRQDVAFLGWTIAERSPAVGFELVQAAADGAVGQSDYPSAAAALQEYVTRVPNHIPALMRLVEICVDGGLEATMYSAQAQLADAYIADGSAAEARFIAEDLVAREPWDRANIERFRRALVLLGEPDPDGVIADRLSGSSPFTSTDVSLAEIDELPVDAAPPPRSDVAAAPTPASTQPPRPSRAPDRAPIDLQSLLGEIEKPPTAKGRSDSVEVDLSIVLEAGAPAATPAPSAAPAADIETVFSQMRDESARRAALEAAEYEYRRGVALYNAGQVDDAVPALQAAARAPRLRFATASLLGRIFRKRGMNPQAIEWLERAAEAPAPSPAESHQLLYELAEVLEAAGEVARALAICLELQADAGDYRDVTARVDRLARVTRG